MRRDFAFGVALLITLLCATLELLITARGAGPTPLSERSFERNGHAVGRTHLSPAQATEARVLVAGSEVGWVLRAGYNRLSMVNAGSHRIAIHRLRVVPAS